MSEQAIWEYLKYSRVNSKRYSYEAKKSLWLRAGQVAAHDTADVVVSQYIAEMTTGTQRRTPNITAQG
jgi:hypothetical protein